MRKKPKHFTKHENYTNISRMKQEEKFIICSRNSVNYDTLRDIKETLEKEFYSLYGNKIKLDYADITIEMVPGFGETDISIYAYAYLDKEPDVVFNKRLEEARKENERLEKYYNKKLAEYLDWEKENIEQIREYNKKEEQKILNKKRKAFEKAKKEYISLIENQ